MNTMALCKYLLICNTITCNGQAANSLYIDDLVHAVLLKSGWLGNVVCSSDINKCCRARCREEFALSALAIRGPIDIAPDPGLARLNRAFEDILASGGNGLAEDVISLPFLLVIWQKLSPVGGHI